MSCAATALETSVVKISGLPDDLLNKFDDKVGFVLYFEHEEANEALVDHAMLEHFRDELYSDADGANQRSFAANARIQFGDGFCGHYRRGAL